MNNAKLMITISNEVLLGCFDMISVYGGDPENKTAEKVVSDVLTSLILGLQTDKLIPIYETETEVFQQLEKYFPDLKSSVTIQLEEIAGKVNETIEEGSSLSSVKQDIDPTSIDKIPDEVEPDGDLEIEKTLNFSELPEKDLLVIEAKGDSLKEKSLLQVYQVISSDLWGTPNARKMWELILSNNEKGDTPAASTEVEKVD